MRDEPLVPARMLNEYLYCPRLMHLEWVQGQFTDNDDTVSGRSVHRRIEGRAGPMPPPDRSDALLEARSLDLDAPRLGMVAKLDIVEGGGGEVTPVERKTGRPRPDGTVWEPEELQLVAQAMILKENGYRVSRGIVSYPATRTRVTIEVTPAREARVRSALEALRRTARGPCPPPLKDSPKCPRCSLVGICLPDETLALRSSRAERPRRLIAADDDARPLVVQEQGARIGYSRGRVIVSKGEETLASLRPIDVSSVCLMGNVQVSAQALRMFIERGVALTHHTYGGWLVAATTGVAARNAQLRIDQHACVADPDRALSIARAMVAGKTRNQRTVLRRNARGDCRAALRDLAAASERAEQATTAAQLLGYEGAGARAYFGQFAVMLSHETRMERGFVFAGRNRRPARDPVNALLSFAYALLLREAVVACIRVGLDPYVGVFHRPRYGRPSLALDVAEEFRPLVADSVVLRFLNEGRATDGCFLSRAGAVALTSPGRRAFIEAFNRRMSEMAQHPVFGYRVSYRRIVELQARILARVFAGEAERYVAFTTR